MKYSQYYKYIQNIEFFEFYFILYVYIYIYI